MTSQEWKAIDHEHSESSRSSADQLVRISRITQMAPDHKLPPETAGLVAACINDAASAIERTVLLYVAKHDPLEDEYVLEDVLSRVQNLVDDTDDLASVIQGQRPRRLR